MPQRGNELAGGLIALAAHAEAPVNDLFQVVAAREVPHVATANRTRYVTPQQHDSDQSDLVDVIALLPSPNFSPRDLRRGVEHVEGIRCDAAPAELVCRN